tara:strand:+ start:12012 stop:12668 length:657 start_codon:yes stop_codon:yes gene_type:complete
MIKHHLADEYLVEYAAGSLPEEESLITATHLAFCRECRIRVEALETLGSVLLEDSNGGSVSEDDFDAVMTKINRQEKPDPKKKNDFDETTLRLIPAPLREYIECDLTDLNWKRSGRGIQEVTLKHDGGRRISLLRIRPDQRVPPHTHSGEEFTMVLDGGYNDGGAHYRSGDVSHLDGTVEHAPVADSDGPCLCLSVQTGPPQLTGKIGRILNPFISGW